VVLTDWLTRSLQYNNKAWQAHRVSHCLVYRYSLSSLETRLPRAMANETVRRIQNWGNAFGVV